MRQYFLLFYFYFFFGGLIKRNFNQIVNHLILLELVKSFLFYFFILFLFLLFLFLAKAYSLIFHLFLGFFFWGLGFQGCLKLPDPLSCLCSRMNSRPTKSPPSCVPRLSLVSRRRDHVVCSQVKQRLSSGTKTYVTDDIKLSHPSL